MFNKNEPVPSLQYSKDLSNDPHKNEPPGATPPSNNSLPRRAPGPETGGVRGEAPGARVRVQDEGALRADPRAAAGREAREGPGDHLPGRALRVHGGLAGAAARPHRPRPQDRRLSHHRRHLGRDLRVHHRVGHDLGRVQLEAELQMVGCVGWEWGVWGSFRCRGSHPDVELGNMVEDM